MPVSVTIDQGAIARALRLRSGIPARRLAARTERTARFAEQEAPGSMGSLITSTVEDGPDGLQGVITSTHYATRFVLDGTRPHLIRPRRKRALRFEVGGRVVFAALVRHPGTRANNFLLRALRLGR
ncbi:hypothetical protein GCM10010387_15460 [Streptomyces inusitatus]|uniref:HK97 gp10 family phage protein n=1 Tax=Streptomyces inusitatus TaxID=68221 RepID=A0A918PU37_9ACTN|nr:hypothetical protein [Streptomyces inusitatus]GGZ23254.1 hypothetical protein GCM10010387_15460 [Streptomyces inusitatus]